VCLGGTRSLGTEGLAALVVLVAQEVLGLAKVVLAARVGSELVVLG
jgi:hypothetical protein